MAGKTVLLLGCGMIAPPIINYFNEHKINTIVASRTVSRVEEVIKGLEFCSAVEFDVTAAGYEVALDALTQKADLVISLLPYIYHTAAAKMAIKHKKHFCTSSYVSDDMMKLADAAKEAGIIMLNEIGVDPGLDHASAMKVIDEVHHKGGKVKSFFSICGGLPNPKFNDNPFGYKLSWSPRGVLLASRNKAIYTENGKVVAQDSLFSEGSYRVVVINGTEYEWYPNRDSNKYLPIYGLEGECETIIRGTFRNRGWCRAINTLSTLGFLELDEMVITGKTFKQFCQAVIKNDNPDVRAGLAQAAKLDESVELDKKVLDALEWLGLFSDEVIQIKENTALDCLCVLFSTKLVYAPGESDMILMQHTFEVEWANAKRETMTSTLVDIGLQPEGFSSMARTVSLPLGCAVRAILDGRNKLTGLYRPVIGEIYNPILDEMETMKPPVKFVEEVVSST